MSTVVNIMYRVFIGLIFFPYLAFSELSMENPFLAFSDVLRRIPRCVTRKVQKA